MPVYLASWSQYDCYNSRHHIPLLKHREGENSGGSNYIFAFYLKKVFYRSPYKAPTCISLVEIMSQSHSDCQGDPENVSHLGLGIDPP